MVRGAWVAQRQLLHQMPTSPWVKTLDISITILPYMACRQFSPQESSLHSNLVPDWMIMGRSLVSPVTFRISSEPSKLTLLPRS